MQEMATHASVLAWRIPGTGEPGGLPSIGSHRVRQSDLAAAAAAALLIELFSLLFSLEPILLFTFVWKVPTSSRISVLWTQIYT